MGPRVPMELPNPSKTLFGLWLQVPLLLQRHQHSLKTRRPLMNSDGYDFEVCISTRFTKLASPGQYR